MSMVHHLEPRHSVRSAQTMRHQVTSQSLCLCNLVLVCSISSPQYSAFVDVGVMHE